ncbi:MAG: toll/interleukin-1 receptor domain-containing protein [Planctomycetes bacterium]|nr:toll/interleukin-1 receptor domain-containing protein [Planctomycetota bacterium]
MNSKVKEPNERGDSRKSNQDSVAPEKLRIFLSYGHDEQVVIAERMKTDLEGRGHEVWFDTEKLRVGKEWEEYIERGINWVSEICDRGRILLLMTPHSVRRPNGFCLNELARALDRQLSVVPVMVVQVEPPLSICRIQWLDLRDCVPLKDRMERYEHRFDQLLDALENDSLDFEGVQSGVRAVLNPLCYRADVAQHLPRFTGRKWLFDMVDSWLGDENGGRVFWLIGKPGVGKTAIASMLSAKRPEIAAFHICRSGDEQKANPKRVVLSIAWQLATQLPDLLDKLNAIGNLEEVCEFPDASTVFERLIVDPAYNGINPPDKPVVILIDGLDEATRDGSNKLADFLAEEMERPPAWMRFILTSRPESAITQPLQAYTPVLIKPQGKENRADITSYLRKELESFEPDPEKLEAAVKRITKKSEYLFLYVEKIREELENKRLTLDNIDEFPQGLGGIYAKFFQRQFSNIGSYKKIYRPVLSVVAAACEPIPIDVLSKVFDWDPYQVDEITDEWGSLFPIVDNRVKPFHRSVLDWLTIKSKAGHYRVLPSEGHRILAEVGWSEYEQAPDSMSEYMKAHLPAHLESAGEKQKLQRCVTDCEFIFIFGRTGRLYELSRYWKNIEDDVLLKMCRDSWEKEKDAGKYFILLAARYLGRLFQHRGDYKTAVEYFGNELGIAETTGDEDARAEALYNLGWCYRHIDEFDKAIKKTEAAKELFEKIGKRSGVAKSLSVKGICHWHKQEDGTALEDLWSSLHIFEKANDVRNQAEAFNHLGIVYRSLGKFEDALKYLYKSKQNHQKLNNVKGLGKCCNSIGTCLWWSGELDKAVSIYQEANQINTELDNQYVLGLTANNLGYVYLEKNELQKAHAEFSRAVDIHRKLKIESYEMMDLSGLALVTFHLGNIDKAKELSIKAVNKLDKYKAAEDLRRVYYNHYVIMKDGGKQEREAAARTLAKAQKLVNARLERIADHEIRESLTNRVPLIKEILEAEITTTE